MNIISLSYRVCPCLPRVVRYTNPCPLFGHHMLSDCVLNIKQTLRTKRSCLVSVCLPDAEVVVQSIALAFCHNPTSCRVRRTGTAVALPGATCRAQRIPSCFAKKQFICKPGVHVRRLHFYSAGWAPETSTMRPIQEQSDAPRLSVVLRLFFFQDFQLSQ